MLTHVQDVPSTNPCVLFMTSPDSTPFPCSPPVPLLFPSRHRRIRPARPLPLVVLCFLQRNRPRPLRQKERRQSRQSTAGHGDGVRPKDRRLELPQPHCVHDADDVARRVVRGHARGQVPILQRPNRPMEHRRCFCDWFQTGLAHVRTG